MIKAVLIDIDNTLLDFDACVQKTMKDGFELFGLGAYDAHMYSVFEQINAGLWGKIEQGLLTYEELLQKRWNEIFSVLGISFDGRRFEEYFRDCLFESAIPVEGAEDILAYLKDRYILCAASNGPYKQQLNRLKRAKMLPYFSEVFISERIGASKPSGRFFSYCLSRLNEKRKSRGACELHPSEVIMIGDSPASDIAGAAGSGFKTCFFNKTMSGNTDCLTADYAVSALCDIKNFL